MEANSDVIEFVKKVFYSDYIEALKGIYFINNHI